MRIQLPQNEEYETIKLLRKNLYTLYFLAEMFLSKQNNMLKTTVNDNWKPSEKSALGDMIKSMIDAQYNDERGLLFLWKIKEHCHIEIIMKALHAEAV